MPSAGISRRKLLCLAALAPVVGSAPWAAQALAQEVDPIPPLSPDTLTAGAGIVRGQMVRASFFNYDSGQSVPSKGTIAILGLDGKVFSLDEFELAPGQGTYFDYDLGQGLHHGERLQFVAQVTLPEIPKEVIPLGANVEVFDAKTGETASEFAPIVLGPKNLLLPHAMGSVGISRHRHQRLRMSIYHRPNTIDGITGWVELRGLDGKMLAVDKFTLAVSQGVFFDYDLGQGLREGERLQFHAGVMVEMAAPPVGGLPLGATMEIYDGNSGETLFSRAPDRILVLAQGM